MSFFIFRVAYLEWILRKKNGTREIRLPDFRLYNKTRTLQGEAVLRWRRNRMGRPLSPPQIHQKNIWMLSKFHKTTSECWRRTSGTRKAAHCLQKEVGKNIKDKETKEVGMEICPGKGVLQKREVSKHQETLSLASLWWALEPQRTT